jgi:carbonic anhydrase
VEGAATAMEAHLVHRNTATGVWVCVSVCERF